jgi:uncharacterized protein (DUF433 family)
MAQTMTTSEKILDKLADGATFKDLQAEFGFTKKDFLTAALFGVAELREEYIELLKTHGKFKEHFR